MYVEADSLNHKAVLSFRDSVPEDKNLLGLSFPLLFKHLDVVVHHIFKVSDDLPKAQASNCIHQM